MRLYSYTLAVDDGAAPNPYGDSLTLTICKPGIRRTSRVGDWIVGLGPTSAPDGSDRSRDVLYAMRVGKKVPLGEYHAYCAKHMPEKIPHWSADEPFERQVGDAIYVPDPKADRGLRQLPGVHNVQNRDTDIDGEFALLADEFYYFGDNPGAPALPSAFDCIRHPYQGYKVHANESVKASVVEWIGRGVDLRGILTRVLH